MRKRSKYATKRRGRPAPPKLPVNFGRAPDALNDTRLLAISSVDAVARGEGQEDHLSCLVLVEMWARRMYVAMVEQGQAERDDGIVAAFDAAAAAISTLQGRIGSNGLVLSANLPAEIEALRELVSINEQIERTSTRRMQRDVCAAMFEELGRTGAIREPGA